MIDEAHALVQLGQGEEALKVLRETLSEAVLAQDRHAEFHAHHGLWKAYSALGQEKQAEFELAAARHYLAFLEEASEEAAEVRAAMHAPAVSRGGCH